MIGSIPLRDSEGSCLDEIRVLQGQQTVQIRLYNDPSTGPPTGGEHRQREIHV